MRRFLFTGSALARMLRNASARSGRIRPHFEPLEARQCLSCTVSVVDDTLFVMGDEGDNAIEIVDEGPSGVRVSCDDFSETHTGIARILVRTGEGSDHLGMVLHGGPNGPHDVRVGMGAGEDVFRLRVDSPPPAAEASDVVEPLARPLRVHLQTGEGSDEVTIGVGHLRRGLVIQAGLGEGDDKFDIASSGEGPGRLEVRVRGDGGADHFALHGGNAPVEDVPSRDVLPHGSLAAYFSGGDGQDEFLADLRGTVAGRTALVAHGGEGDDHLAATVHAELHAGLGIRLIGGQGDDTLRTELMGHAAARVATYLHGGEGADNAQVTDRLNVAEGVLKSLHISLGAGNDQARVDAVNRALDGFFALKVDGGGESDRIDVDLAVHSAAGTGRLGALVLGGDGDDGLRMAIHDAALVALANTAEEPVGLVGVRALIDGGEGFDTAAHTRNVKVRNCEEDILIE